MESVFYAAIAALPLGDDTPVLLYAILGVLALGLVIAMTVVSKKSKEDSNDSTSGKRSKK
ncbi:MAG: hypothetical protein IKI77_10865 [Oscillospiraceae bacterium]|nr:hypothetical protein [Oscillospiraceae bacterium]